MICFGSRVPSAFIRPMSLAGQAITVLFVYLVLGFDLPLAACLMTIGAGAIFTAALNFAYPAQHRPSVAVMRNTDP